MGEWLVIDLRIGRASSREAGCTATAGVVRESYPLVSSCAEESAWKTAKRKDLD